MGTFSALSSITSMLGKHRRGYGSRKGAATRKGSAAYPDFEYDPCPCPCRFIEPEARPMERSKLNKLCKERG